MKSAARGNDHGCAVTRAVGRQEHLERRPAHVGHHRGIEYVRVVGPLRHGIGVAAYRTDAGDAIAAQEAVKLSELKGAAGSGGLTLSASD